MNENLYLMWLSRIEGLGFKKQELLLNYFGLGRDIFGASKKDLDNVAGISEKNVIDILANQKMTIVERYTKELADLGIKYISKFDNEYPSLLKEIYDPPLGIYILGNLPDKTLPKLSIIGSRRCSEYGLIVTNKLSKDLARKGIVIVSGMAKGIDSQAHIGALDVLGYTIAVVGTGVDLCYPAENISLKKRILEKGCIISEFAPGTKAKPIHFPMRNRIISGISEGVLVVEAAERSGTLITVDQALEQGRQVFTVPGNITSKLSKGTNNLLKQGATLVTGHEDILECLGFENNIFSEQMTANLTKSLLSQEEKVVYDCVGLEPVDIESIIIETKNQLSTVQYILTMLELKGYIKKLPGQRYIKSL